VLFHISPIPIYIFYPGGLELYPFPSLNRYKIQPILRYSPARKKWGVRPSVLAFTSVCSGDHARMLTWLTSSSPNCRAVRKSAVQYPLHVHEGWPVPVVSQCIQRQAVEEPVDGI